MTKSATFAAAIFTAGAAFAGARMVANEYVTDGLAARWDAIDNAGTGVHDPSAAVWKDLAGSNDLVLTNDCSVWTNGNAFYMNTLIDGKCPAYGSSAATSYKTIEIVYKKATSKGRILFCGGDMTRYVVFDYTDTDSPWVNAKVYFDGAKATQHTVVSDTGPTSLVALYDDSDAVVDIFRDGAENNAGAKNANTWSVDGNSAQVRLGCRSRTTPNTGNGWEGEVYTIRLYDRQLAASEIARNYALDTVRFFGATLSTNVIVATSVAGLEGGEECGMYAITDVGHTFTAPSQRTKDGIVYTCTGYTLERWKGSGWSAPVKYATTSYEASDASAKVRLTWQWQYGHAVVPDDLVPFTAADYEQSGLVAHWDAIDNAGTGVHDPGATKWKNLVDENDMTIAPNRGSEWRRGCAFHMDTVAEGLASAYSAGAVYGVKTIEIACTQEKRRGRFLLYGGDRSRFVMFAYATNSVALAAPEAMIQFDGSNNVTNSPTKYAVVRSGEPMTLVATYDGANAVSGIYCDGAEKVDGTVASTWNASQTIVMLGSRSTSEPQANVGWAGEVYAIRLYNRALTAEEIARNHEIDEARFFGRLQVTNVVVASSVRGVSGREPEGEYMLPAGGHTFNAPASVTIGEDTYSCTGYTLETWDGADWGEPAVHAGELSAALTDTTEKVRLTWQWSHTAGPGFDAAFDDYVTDGLVLHLDGVRNTGSAAVHSDGAAQWADLATPGGFARFVDGGGNSAWMGDGYFFDGTPKATYAMMDGTRTLDGAYTVQIVCDFDPYASARLDTSWPSFVGTVAGADQFAIYCNHDSVNDPVTRFKAVNTGSGFNLTEWKRHIQYLTALFDGSQVSFFEEATPPSFKAFAKSPGTQVFTFGSGEGSDLGFESRRLTGTIKAVRFYNRALTDAELRRNRAVDEARLFRRGASAAAGELVVDSDVDGLSGDLPCGVYRPASGYVFTAPAEAVLGETVYELAGYTLETWNGSSWSSAATAAGTSAAPDVSSASKRLTWNWVVKSRLERLDYDVGDYVQDGLYLHLDGIRNAGADVPHDMAAETWVNLGSGGPDLDATFDYAKDGVGGDGWDEDGYSFVNGGRFAKLATNPVFNYYVTVEVVCDAPENGGTAKYPTLFGAQGDYLNIYYHNANNQLGFKIFSNAAAADGTTRSDPGYKAPGGLVYLSGWEGQYATASWSCRKYQLFQTAAPDTNKWTGTWHYNLNKFSGRPFYIGGIYAEGETVGVNDRRLSGKVQAVRVYNRTLTDEELAHNRKIDEARFKGNPPEFNVVVSTRYGNGAGETLSEPVGTYKVEGEYTFSATEVMDASGVLKPVAGCFVSVMSGGAWGQRVWRPGQSYTYRESSGSAVRIMWCVGEGLRILVR